MARSWTGDDIMALTRGFQEACVVVAGAELDVFGGLAAAPMADAALAERLGTDPRATAVLLDALAAMELLVKEGDAYRAAPGVADVLTADGPQSMLAMAQHLGNCLRRWAMLARVVQTGRPADREPSVRGEEGDRASFIGAMDNVSRRMAPGLVAALGPPRFRRLLDLGGGSGTWTIAFLRAAPGTTATLFDLPPVIPMAQRRLAEAGLAGRVTLVPGDYETDPLPSGADLVWVSAIIHQNSPDENLALFRKVFDALEPGGQVLIRDIVMDPSRTRPAMGALFAINMLVSTPGGSTYTLDEVREALEAAGFEGVELLRQGDGMDGVVRGVKPTAQ